MATAISGLPQIKRMPLWVYPIRLFLHITCEKRKLIREQWQCVSANEDGGSGSTEFPGELNRSPGALLSQEPGDPTCQKIRRGSDEECDHATNSSLAGSEATSAPPVGRVRELALFTLPRLVRGLMGTASARLRFFEKVNLASRLVDHLRTMRKWERSILKGY